MTAEPVNALAARAANGDREALGELLAAHLPSIEAFIRLRVGRLLRHKESCADLAHSACREALQALPRFEFRGDAEFRAWLFKHAVHKMATKARHYSAGKRDHRREAPVARGDSDSQDPELAFGAASICSPSRHAMGKEQLAEFERAFAELPEDYREAISLYKIAELSYAEIATRMHKSDGAVRNLVYRGLARIAIATGRAHPRGDGERGRGEPGPDAQ